jgi:DNA-binding response OmpR family regulator
MNTLPCRILIVEDEAPVRDVIRSAFDTNKNRIFSAGSIEEAEKLLKRNGADLLILDRILPDGDGLQLCAKLRGDREHQSTPVLMLSGKSDTSDKVLGLKLGADDYLAKPFHISELRARADALLRRAQTLSQSSYVKKRLWRY